MPTTNRVRLTLSLIEHAMRNPPPEGTTTFLRDKVVDGLALRIHPTGRATYTLLLPGGQRKKLLALNAEWKEVPEYWNGHLDKVRQRAKEDLLPYRSLSSLLADQRSAPKRATPKPDAAPTKIELVVRRFTREHLEKHTGLRHVRDCEARFRLYVLPKWKGRDVRSITRRDVRELVQGLRSRESPTRRTGPFPN